MRNHAPTRFAALLMAAGLGCSGAWAQWSDPLPLATGVQCSRLDSSDAQAVGGLVVFAGWTVQPAWAWRWALALARSPHLPHPMAWICAVQGPADSTYRRKDIDTSALAREVTTTTAKGPGPVTVVAHSSGAFVAHHWLQQLRQQGAAALLGQVRYFNLDGDIGRDERALDSGLIDALAEVHAVYAVDRHSNPPGESANAKAMRALHALAPTKVRLHTLDAGSAGCAGGARWCLHSALVTQRPHNPNTFDLAQDYGALSGERPVQDGFWR
jgi:hypothetical protein